VTIEGAALAAASLVALTGGGDPAGHGRKSRLAGAGPPSARALSGAGYRA